MSAPQTLKDPRSPELTALEDIPQYEAFRQAVHDNFRPSSLLHQMLADDYADLFWIKKRLTAIANQVFSQEILDTWDEVSQKYPNADSMLHTVYAWNRLHTKDGHARTQAYIAGAFTRSLSELRSLEPLLERQAR
ncbi:MAG: hypothetical protein HY821_00085 [Acidobacteria bacterium]|nr:hypothetical protein [Acidobacteriota bacterium]